MTSSHSSQSPGLDRMTVDLWGEVIAGVDVRGCQVRRRIAGFKLPSMVGDNE